MLVRETVGHAEGIDSIVFSMEQQEADTCKAPQSAPVFKTPMQPRAGTLGGFAIRFRFGERVRSLRLDAKQTSVDLAFLVGISHQHLEDIENGAEDVDLPTLEQLAYALEVSIAVLVQGCDRPQSTEPDQIPVSSSDNVMLNPCATVSR